MNLVVVRWLDLSKGALLDRRWFLLLTAIAPPLIAAVAIAAPLAVVAALAAVALSALLWKSEHAAALSLIALGCSVKVHYYTGFVTIFPEYIVIVLACALWFGRWLEGDRGIGERRMGVLFAWLLFAGLVSIVNAINVSRVLTKELLIVFDAAIFFLMLRGLRTERELGRAMLWVEWTAVFVAAFGLMQFISPFIGWDLSLSFLYPISNPEMHLGIGAPVVWQFSKTFRANGFFNDSNVFAGWLAATMCVVLALCLHHAEVGRRARASAETVLLFALGVLMLMTLSRSGGIAMFAGFGVVFAFMPRILTRTSFWILSAGAVVLAAGIASWLGVDPFLVLVRMSTTMDRDDLSNRMHLAVAMYALDLFRRFPVVGAGLNNFGQHYAVDVDAYGPGMMSHSVYLSFFSEAGLLGGAALLAVVVAILRRPWRALLGPAHLVGSRTRAWLVGLLAALVALAVANIFYDYYLRTFVWVIGGMAVAASRLRERRVSET